MDAWNSIYQPGLRIKPDRFDHVYTFYSSFADVDIMVVVVLGGSIYIRGVETCTADDNPYNKFWERQLDPAATSLEFTAAALEIFSKMHLAPEMLRDGGHLFEFIARSADAHFCAAVTASYSRRQRPTTTKIEIGGQ